MAVTSRPPAVRRNEAPALDAELLRRRVDELLNRHPAVGFAAGVVRNGRLEFFSAHGYADIASRVRISQDTVFRIASITKTFTAIAIMQLVERGLIDLDAPAAEYLRSYRLVPAKARFRPASVRHLLTHTSGVPQLLHLGGLVQPVRGDWFPIERPLPSLAEHYGGRLRLVTEPGTRFAYSDHGFATLGQIVEDVTGTPLARYMRERIFEPLGMSSTDLVRSSRVAPRLATGYAIGARGARPVADGEMVTVGAANIYSTPADMARWIAALTGEGSNEHGSILRPETLAVMFEPQFQLDPRLPGMGLGFFRVMSHGHPGIEHEGILPGFNSQVFVAPQDGVGVMAFTNGAGGALMWMTGETGRLYNAALGVPDEVIREDVPHHPEIWADLCGWYRLSAQLTDEMSRSIAGAGAEVFVRRGRLMIRAVTPIPASYRGFELHPDDPDDPYAFRIDLSRFGIGAIRVLFSGDFSGAVTRVHNEMVPMWLEKQPRRTNPRLWVRAAAYGVAAGVAARRLRKGR